jgi:hypothetical protein
MQVLIMLGVESGPSREGFSDNGKKFGIVIKSSRMTEVGYRPPYKVDPPAPGGNKKLFHSQDNVSSTSLVQ